jgi:hypothetical protein
MAQAEAFDPSACFATSTTIRGSEIEAGQRKIPLGPDRRHGARLEFPLGQFCGQFRARIREQSRARESLLGAINGPRWACLD